MREINSRLSHRWPIFPRICFNVVKFRATNDIWELLDTTNDEDKFLLKVNQALISSFLFAFWYSDQAHLRLTNCNSDWKYILCQNMLRKGIKVIFDLHSSVHIEIEFRWGACSQYILLKSEKCLLEFISNSPSEEMTRLFILK